MTSPAAMGAADDPPSGTISETNFSPKRVLGRIEAVTSLGHVRGAVLVEAERDVGALGGRLVVEHLADDDALDLDVRAVRQLEPDARGVHGDLVVVAELLGEHAVGGPHRAEHQHQEQHAQGLGPHRRAHPASRTVVAAPQIAMDSSRSSTLIATMLVRTARPTATPTPAGPPDAL